MVLAWPPQNKTMFDTKLSVMMFLCFCFCFYSWGLLGPSCNEISGNCFLYRVSSSICYYGIKYGKVYACCHCQCFMMMLAICLKNA